MESRPEVNYKALVAQKHGDSETELTLEKLNTRNLPRHDVLINVIYSSLNYKDALSASGNSGVTKSYPHTPGIDAAGIVEWSKDPRFKTGDKVIATSYDLGQNTDGGFGEYISVPGDWIVPLPENMTLKESMIFGTAGFTAAYGVKKLISQGIETGSGKIVVTGATGGVGSLAISVLSHLGFTVLAVTGKSKMHSFLVELGANEVLSRDSVQDVPGGALLSSRWNGAVDTVGGGMLDAVIRQTSHNGVVACCGNVLGGTLSTSIYPFILRGVSLMGIDSGMCLMKDRKRIWKLLAEEWKPELPGQLFRIVTLRELPNEIKKILDGRQVGRIVVSLHG